MVEAHTWCVVTLGEARRECFSQCKAAADVVQAHMWCVVSGKRQAWDKGQV